MTDITFQPQSILGLSGRDLHSTSCKSHENSPSSKRKVIRRRRSKSVPSARERKPEPITQRIKPRRQNNIAWTIDTTSFTKRETTKLTHGKDLRIACSALHNQKALLEALIIETLIKEQRQINLSKLFTDRHETQTSLWNRIKWYNSKGYIFAIVKIIREWIKASKSTLWCKEHHINLPLLHLIWNQCKSVYAALCTVNKEFITNIQKFENLKFHSDENEVEECLMEMLVTYYGQNLSFYRCYNAAGYYSVTKKTSFQVDFTPGCSTLGDPPNYLIPLWFPKSKLITCFLPINESTAKFIATCQNIDLTNIMNEKHLKLVEFGEIGTEQKQRIIGFLEHLCDKEEIFFDTTNRKLKVFVALNVHQKVSSMVHSYLEKMKDEIKQETISLSKVIHLKLKEKCKQQVTINMKPGLYCEKIICEQRETTVVQVTSENIQDLNDMKETLFQNYHNLSIRPVFNGYHTSGFHVACSSPEQARDMSTFLQERKCISHQLNQRCLRPYTYTRKGLNFSFVEIPATGVIKITKDVNLSDMHDNIKKLLVQCFDDNFKISYFIKSPLVMSEVEKGIEIHFTFKGKDAEEQIKILESKTIMDTKISFQNKENLHLQLYQLQISLNSKLYKVLSPEILRLIHSEQSKIISMKENQYGQVKLILKAKCIQDRQMIKQQLQSIFTPQSFALTHKMPNILHLPEGVNFLNFVMAKSKTYLYTFYDGTIKIHGNGKAKELAVQLLETEGSGHGKWVSHTIKDNESHFLETIVPFVDSKTKTIPTMPSISHVTFDPDNCQVICQIIGKEEEITETLTALDWDESCLKTYAEVRTCASCLENISIDLEPVYMLEGCGHYYCPPCIIQHINVVVKEKSLPLRCAECNEYFCIQDFLNLADTIKDIDPHKIINATIEHCIVANLSKYMNCPNFYCGALLDLEDKCQLGNNEKNITCSYCSTQICIPCKSVLHVDVSCEEYQQDIVSWVKVDPANRKRCPSCNMGIEKIGGCSNVGCVYCKKAICWKCSEFFDTEDLCYRHLRIEHGGY